MSTSPRTCGETPSTCKADGVTLHHYYVISGEVKTSYGYDEPPEYWRDVAVVDARTKREALLFGIKTPEMAAWVQEARGDGTNPLFGCRVEHAGCKHYPCWCDGDFESGCHQCDEEHIATCEVAYCWCKDPFEESKSVKYL